MNRMPMVTIRYWAAAREAAGLAEEQVEAANLEEALAAARELHGARLSRVLDICAFLVDEKPAGSRDPRTVLLSEGSTIEALPPFAGG